MKGLFLINPSSRGGKSLKLWAKYAKELPDVKGVILENIEQATTLAATVREVDMVVAVGGDGTINAVANGIMLNSNPNIKLGVLYTGTSPDFCKFHNIPIDLSAVDTLSSGKYNRIKILNANGRAFLCSANLGIGANVATFANRFRPKLGDKLGTALALFMAIIKSKPIDYFINGEQIKSCNHLLITKMPYIAGGLKLALPAISDDEFIVWYVHNLNAFRWLKLIVNLYRGKVCGNFKIYNSAITIRAKEHVDFEFDGDRQGALPLRVELSSRKIELIGGY